MGSWLFGNKAPASGDQPPATSLRIQTSIQGRPITILWGTQRVAANLIWQGGFSSQTVQVGSTGSSGFLDHIFSKAQPIFQTFYFTSLAMALCNGMVGVPTFTNRMWNGTTATTIDAQGFTIFRGGFDQIDWPYMDAAFPSQSLAYKGVAYAAQASWALGTSSDLPVVNWEVTSITAGYGPQLFDANAADVTLDLVSNDQYGLNFPFYRMDQQLSAFFAYGPATGMVVSPIITEQVSAQTFLSDLFDAVNSSPRWSSGQLSIVPWGDAGATAGAVTTTTNGDFAIPPTNLAATLYPIIRVMQDRFVSDIGVTGFTKVTTSLPNAGEYTVTPDGLYTFNPADAATNIQISYTSAAITSYQPDLRPLYDITADQFLPNQGTIGSGSGSGDEPVVCVNRRQSELLNVIKYEYLARDNNYDPVAIDSKDEASIDTYGVRPSELKTRHMFALADAAAMSATLNAAREQIPAAYQFTLGPEFILIDVEDFVTLTRPTMGLSRQIVRVNEIQENDDGSFTYTAEPFLGTASAPLYGAQATDPNNVDKLVDPGPTTDVVIFTPPDALAAPPTDNIAIYAAVTGTSQFYAGSNVFFSIDGVNYSAIGVALKATMGFLSATLASHTSPDTVNTMSVDLTESSGVLPASTHALADSQNPVCLVANEYISYGDLTLTSAFNYDATYLTRGNYGSTIAGHVAHDNFVLVDGNMFKMTLPNTFAGQTIYFKFQPFNIYGVTVADISSLPVYPYVVGAPVVAPSVGTFAGVAQFQSGAIGTGAFAGTSAFQAFAQFAFDAGATLINTTLSGGNLVAQHANTLLGGASNINYKTAGKRYFEMTLDVVTAGVSGVCILPSDQDYTTTHFGAAMYAPTGVIWASGGFSGSSLGTIASAAVIGCASDVTAGLVWFRVAPSGDWNGDPLADPATGTGGIDMNGITLASRAPALVFGDTGSDGTEKGTANFGTSAFVGAVPTGFTPGWY